MDYSFISRIKTFGKEITYWPSKKHIQVEYVSSDNSIQTSDVPKAEADLMLFIKTHLKGKVKDSVLTTLCDKIEKYGSEKFDDGEFNESCNNEDL